MGPWRIGEPGDLISPLHQTKVAACVHKGQHSLCVIPLTSVGPSAQPYGCGHHEMRWLYDTAKWIMGRRTTPFNTVEGPRGAFPLALRINLSPEVSRYHY